LIDALLTLARGQAGPRVREPFDLATLTGEVLLTRREEAELRGVEVRQTLSPAPAAGDQRLVERLIANLVDNALAYNEPEGRVEVIVRTRAGHSVVSATNTGPVVPTSEIERLLQPFQRGGPDRMSRGDGVGLGLSIVRAIAEAHGAKLDVNPRAEGGLIVEVRFPVPTTVDIAADSSTSPRFEQGRPTDRKGMLSAQAPWEEAGQPQRTA
jgi:signal transduction histidine kinase